MQILGCGLTEDQKVSCYIDWGKNSLEKLHSDVQQALRVSLEPEMSVSSHQSHAAFISPVTLTSVNRGLSSSNRHVGGISYQSSSLHNAFYFAINFHCKLRDKRNSTSVLHCNVYPITQCLSNALTEAFQMSISPG